LNGENWVSNTLISSYYPNANHFVLKIGPSSLA